MSTRYFRRAFPFPQLVPSFRFELAVLPFWPPQSGADLLAHAVTRSVDGRLVTVLSQEPRDIDGLVKEASLPREEVESQLTQLEAVGLVERIADGDRVVFRSRWPLWRVEEWERLEQSEREAASTEIAWALEECLAIQQRVGRRLEEKGSPKEGFPARVHIVSFEPAPPEQSDEF